MAIVPLKQLAGRAPEHGRLRYGDWTTTRGGKSMPTAIDKWRFTSPDRTAIEALAEAYGGEPEEWVEPKASPANQWQLRSKANSINVWLPRASFTCQYELWTGDGLQRRCDGEACRYWTALGHVDTDCVCIADGLPKGKTPQGWRDPACKPYSRVNLILPDIPFGGVWRLEVKGEIFMNEAPGMIALIEEISAGGMSKVRLQLTKRSSIVNGQKANYIVPQFFADATAQQLMDGTAAVRAGELSPVRAAGELVAVAEVVEEVFVVEDSIEDDPEIEDAVLLEFPSERRYMPPVEPDVEGWDRPPGTVPVMRNPDPNGPRYIRKPR